MARIGIKINSNAFTKIMDNIEGSLLALSQILVTQTKERFQTKKDPEGKNWKPLCQSTIEWSANRYKTANRRNANDTLVDTGRLRSSIYPYVESTPTNKSFGVRITADYWKYHQHGTKGKPETPYPIPGLNMIHPGLPKRGIVGLYDNQKQELKEELIDMISQGFKK